MPINLGYLQPRDSQPPAPASQGSAVLVPCWALPISCVIRFSPQRGRILTPWKSRCLGGRGRDTPDGGHPRSQDAGGSGNSRGTLGSDHHAASQGVVETFRDPGFTGFLANMEMRFSAAVKQSGLSPGSRHTGLSSRTGSARRAKYLLLCLCPGFWGLPCSLDSPRLRSLCILAFGAVASSRGGKTRRDIVAATVKSPSPRRGPSLCIRSGLDRLGVWRCFRKSEMQGHGLGGAGFTSGPSSLSSSLRFSFSIQETSLTSQALRLHPPHPILLS